MVYQDSKFIPACHLLGQWLNPPTVGHAAIMEGFQVWPRINESNQYQEQIGDLMVVTGILTRPWQSYFEWLDTWASRRFYKKVSKEISKVPGLQVLNEYHHWIEQVTAKIPIIAKPKVGSSPIGVGEIGFLMVKLCRAFGWTLDQVKDLGYREALYLSVALDEQDQLVTVDNGANGDWRELLHNDELYEALKGGRG